MSKININTATITQLQSLSGVGLSLAKKIYDYRKKHGHFKSFNDISTIPGVSKEILSEFSKHASLTTPKNKRTTIHKEQTATKINFEGLTSKNRGKIKFSTNSLEPLTIAFGSTNLRGKKNIPLSAVKLKKLPRINTDNQNFIDFKIPLSRFTPPGTHTLDILIDGKKHPVEIDIEEKVSVNTTPNRFFIEAEPGKTINKDVYVKNLGNLPVVFSDPGPIILETDFIECRAIRHVVRHMDKNEATLEKLLCLATEKLEEIYDEGGTIKIRLNHPPKIIAPGTTEKMSLNIAIPKTLKRPNRYNGMYRFYNATLSFTVIPTKNNIS